MFGSLFEANIVVLLAYVARVVWFVLRKYNVYIL